MNGKKVTREVRSGTSNIGNVRSFCNPYIRGNSTGPMFGNGKYRAITCRVCFGKGYQGKVLACVCRQELSELYLSMPINFPCRHTQTKNAAYFWLENQW